MPVPTIYRDSTSAMFLITNGDGITRNKHLTARVHWGKEAYDNGCIHMEYNGRKKMKAFGLCKSFYPEKQHYFGNFIQE